MLKFGIGLAVGNGENYEPARMRILLNRPVLTMAAVVLCACGGGNGVQNADPDSAAESGTGPISSVLGRYRGIATSAIEDVDVFGNPVAVRQFQQPIRVDIALAASNEGIVEQNPFRLVIESDPQTRVPQEGQVVLKSSVLVPVPDDVGAVLLQFWQLNFDGATLVGQLLDTHQAESAAAANAFFSQIQIAPNLNLGVPVTCIMNQGTVLQGTLNGNEIGLRIEGSGACTGGSAPKRFIFEVGALRAASTL